jgi:hypothetical protein
MFSPTDLFALGPEVPSSTLPNVTKTTVGGPRIVTDDAFESRGKTLVDFSAYVGPNLFAKDYQSPTPTRIDENAGLSLRDTQTNVACVFLKAEDGLLRCLPKAGEFSRVSDPITCQTAVYQTVAGTPTTKMPAGSFVQGNWQRK